MFVPQSLPNCSVQSVTTCNYLSSHSVTISHLYSDDRAAAEARRSEGDRGGQAWQAQHKQSEEAWTSIGRIMPSIYNSFTQAFC